LIRIIRINPDLSEGNKELLSLCERSLFFQQLIRGDPDQSGSKQYVALALVA
jgi:hypothetical protein